MSAKKSESKSQSKSNSPSRGGSAHTAECFLHVPIEAVFEAFVEPTLLGGWLAPEPGVEIDVERAVGGRWAVVWPGGEGDTVIGSVETLRLMEQLTVSWEGGSFELSLEPGLGGTHLELSVDGSPRLETAVERLNSWFASLRT